MRPPVAVQEVVGMRKHESMEERLLVINLRMESTLFNDRKAALSAVAVIVDKQCEYYQSTTPIVGSIAASTSVRRYQGTGSLLSKKCSMVCHWLIDILLADLEKSHSGRTYSRNGSVYLRCPATIDTRAKHHASEGSWAIISTLTRSFRVLSGNAD